MDAKKALLFVILCCFSLLNCIHAFSESTVGKHGKGIPEEKFTGSHTADHHNAPKVILFLFGTCMLGGKFWFYFRDQFYTPMNLYAFLKPVRFYYDLPVVDLRGHQGRPLHPRGSIYLSIFH